MHIPKYYGTLSKHFMIVSPEIRRRAQILRKKLISIFSVLLLTASVQAQFQGVPEPKYEIKIKKSVIIPMQDGTKLSTDIYFPEGYEGKLPTILIRTPYGKDESKLMIRVAGLFARQGYAVAYQDKRGRYESEGNYIPSIGDADGRAYNIEEGILRARYREGQDKEVWMK